MDWVVGWAGAWQGWQLGCHTPGVFVWLARVVCRTAAALQPRRDRPETEFIQARVHEGDAAVGLLLGGEHYGPECPAIQLHPVELWPGYSRGLYTID